MASLKMTNRRFLFGILIVVKKSFWQVCIKNEKIGLCAKSVGKLGYNWPNMPKVLVKSPIAPLSIRAVGFYKVLNEHLPSFCA